MCAVVILPWAEYMVPKKEQSSVETVLTNSGIDMSRILHISHETEILQNILEDSRYGKILRVNTAEDLEELTDLLFGRPLCLRVTLVHTEVASKYSADKVSIWEGDFAVIINTSNNKIKRQLKEVFDVAKHNASRNKRFSLEINFGDLLEGWYLQNIDIFSGCDDFQSTKTKKARLVITNHTPFNHCFDCSPKWWLCLGPCWLLIAPSYFMYRLLTCKDISLKLQAPVTSFHGLRRKTNSLDLSRSLTVVNYNSEGRISTALTSDQSQMSELNLYGTL